MTSLDNQHIQHMVTRNDWQLRVGSGTIEYHLINNNIIYGKSTGQLTEDDLVLSTDLLRQVVETVAQEVNTYYLLIETERSQLSRKARKFYIEAVKTIYYAYPFQVYLLLHPNKFFRTVLNVTRPLLPFPAIAVVDIDEALRIIAGQPDCPDAGADICPVDNLSDFHGEHHQIFDELLEYLAGLNWKEPDNDSLAIKPETYPFKPVFDVIHLVKSDIDHLLREQAVTQEALNQSKDRYRTIIEDLGDGYYESTLDGTLTLVNKALCGMYGYPREELLGIHYRELMDAANTADTLKRFNALYTTRQRVKKFEQEIIRKDGSPCSVEVSASLIKDDNGEITGFRGIVRDVTESRKMREQLKQREAQYRLLLDHADDAIFIIQDGVIKFPYRTGKEFFGYAESQVIDVGFIGMVYPDDREMVADRYIRRMKGEKVMSPYTFRINTRDGDVAWVQANAVLVEWEGGPAALVFLRDITVQKNMETRLRQTHKMEAIGTLAGGIAHDFNNILAAIMGYTDVVLGETEEETKAHQNLMRIRKAVFRARGIIRQILTFSRPVHDDRPQSIRISVIINEVVGMLERTLPRHIRITQSLSEGSDRILATASQLHEVIMNLCANAVHAMSDGGGVLSLSLEPVKLNSGFVSQYAEAEPGRYLRLMVTDTGCGISPEVKDRLFEPYFTTKPHGQGTGMGLAVAHGIITANGGIITVDSEEGKGTTFSVFFPVIAEAAVSGRFSLEDAQVLPEGDERILFVDDKRQLCEIGKNLLERFGYTVVTATSAEQALDIFSRESDRFNLVIVDLLMPEMAGDKLAREIYLRCPQMPVMICAGHDDALEDVDLTNTTVTEFVAKPYIVEDFALSVRRMLDQRKRNDD